MGTLTPTEHIQYLTIACDQRLRQLKNFEKQFGVKSDAYKALQQEISHIRENIDHYRQLESGGEQTSILELSELADRPTRRTSK